MKILIRNSLLGTTAIVGDANVNKAYMRVMYYDWGVVEKFNSYLPRGDYGSGLDLILLEFCVEGSHDWFVIPGEIKMGRYSQKEKAISIKIPMLKEISNAILGDDIEIVNEYLVSTFTEVGGLLESSKALAKIDFDKKKFNIDYHIFLGHLLETSRM